MSYTREELDRIEDVWAYNLHGRPIFISREDSKQLQLWGDAGVPADDVISAINIYFQRRAQSSKGRGFVALSYLTNDVAKAVKLSSGIDLNEVLKENAIWNVVKEPMRSDARGRSLFKIWRQIKVSAPSENSPAFLAYLDAERKAFKELAIYAESHLGYEIKPLQINLKATLLRSNFIEGTVAWYRAWEHSWMRIVCDFFGIPWQL